MCTPGLVAFRNFHTPRTHFIVAGAYTQQHSVIAPTTAPDVASLKLQLQSRVGASAPELVLPQQAYPQDE
eukprot:12916552-Prorocentrum_lima.AAC.1